MLREKEENDEKHIEKLFRKYIGKLLQYQSRKLNQKIHNSINLSAKKTIIDIRLGSKYTSVNIILHFRLFRRT